MIARRLHIPYNELLLGGYDAPKMDKNATKT
jgi:hypothetical protein